MIAIVSKFVRNTWGQITVQTNDYYNQIKCDEPWKYK